MSREEVTIVIKLLAECKYVGILCFSEMLRICFLFETAMTQNIFSMRGISRIPFRTMDMSGRRDRPERTPEAWPEGPGPGQFATDAGGNTQ